MYDRDLVPVHRTDGGAGGSCGRTGRGLCEHRLRSCGALIGWRVGRSHAHHQAAHPIVTQLLWLQQPQLPGPGRPAPDEPVLLTGSYFTSVVISNNSSSNSSSSTGPPPPDEPVLLTGSYVSCYY